MKWNPYLGEWVILPEAATVSDDELRRAALQRIADNAKIVTSQNVDGTYTHTYSFAEQLAKETDTGGAETLFGKPVRTATTPLTPPDAKLVVGPPYIAKSG